ncbi:hypothetical protein [Erysipelatoclostridium sp. MSK.7.34]|nr:hypothetical protein [Erysipelatoclostridium sp. MSK.7.34]
MIVGATFSLTTNRSLEPSVSCLSSTVTALPALSVAFICTG